MKKYKAIMVVMNTLDTDARVQRAACALQDVFDLTVIGVGNDCGQQRFNQILLNISSNKGFIRYFEYERKIKCYLRHEYFEIFYAHDYFSAALAAWVKRRFPNCFVIYDAHELIFPAKGFSTNNRDKYFSYYERKAIKYSDLVVCASNDRAALMKEYYGMNEEPLVIDNISNLPILHDNRSNELIKSVRSSLGSRKYILVYAGVLSSARRIDNLFKIIMERKDASLLVIGDGDDKNRLKDLAQTLIPDRYYFTGKLPYQYLGCLLEICDVGYISYPNNTLNNTYCAPNKIYEYASVGLPMIAPYNPTIKKFFDSNKIGVIDDDLGKAFDILCGDISVYKQNCYRFSCENQWEKKAETLINSIINLIET